MGVLTSIIVDFGSAEEGSISAELDDELNNGKSEFRATDEIYIAVYKYPLDIVIKEVVPSSGRIEYIGIVDRSFDDERLTFVNEHESSISHPINPYKPYSGKFKSVKWYGNIGQQIEVNGSKVTIVDGTPCVCDVDYDSIAHIYKLIPPKEAADLSGDEDWPIEIYIGGDNP